MDASLDSRRLALLTIWQGDPLIDIRVLQRPPLAVFLGGTRVTPAPRTGSR